MAQLMNGFIQEFELSNDNRISHFLGQAAIESAYFRTTTEYGDGKKYNGRRDLGNTQPGDGPRFKGRGLIQLTGRSNYAQVGKLVGQDLVSNPASVAAFPLALTVSGIYWRTRAVDGNKNVHLNDAADQDDVQKVTRNVNGRKMLALRERTQMTRRAYTLLQADTTPGALTAAIPHLDVDPAVFDWVNPNDASGWPPSPDSVKQPSFKPPKTPKRFLAYVFEGLPHYSDGTVDMELLPSDIAKPDESKGPVAYYLNGQIVYQSEVSTGAAPSPRLEQILSGQQAS
jgi:predicted chitinase